MDVFGITGGIGMGKSTAGEILQRLGVSVVDTDVLAREVVLPGSPGLIDVVREFGPEILDAAGALRREALGRRVFADPAALARLNALLHPRIRSAWQAQLDSWRRSGVSRAAVIIPLLFENGYAEEFHWVACVACTDATQQVRLRERGWDATETARRIATQLPATEKMARAQHVIWTEGSRPAHEAQWERLLTWRASLFKTHSTV